MLKRIMRIDKKSPFFFSRPVLSKVSNTDCKASRSSGGAVWHAFCISSP